MALPKELPDAPPPVVESEPDGRTLRERAVAIDPPPRGAMGIEELLGRFERFAEAQAMTDMPGSGPVGVRELLARLGSLADAGYFSSRADDKSEDKDEK
jgi:hypothetical protein